MKDIKSVRDLNRMQKVPFALCFIYVEERTLARVADLYLSILDRIISAEKDPILKCIYRGDPWKQRFLHPWIYKNRKLRFKRPDGEIICLGNHGTLIWLSRGKVVDVERWIIKHDIDELWNKTRRLMKRAGLLRPLQRSKDSTCDLYRHIEKKGFLL